MLNIIILAAGRGSRLKKTTIDTPKGLIKIYKDKTLLDLQVKILKQFKNSKIIIVTGFQKNKIINKFKDEKFTFLFNKKWKKTNMLYSLYCADKFLKKNSSLVLYSDILYSKEIISKIISNKKNLCVAYDAYWLNLWKKRFNKPELDAESFYINKYNQITEIGKKIKKNEIKKIKGQYMGIIKINPRAWKIVKNELNIEEIKKNHLTHMLDKIINKNIIPIYGVKNTKPWYEIDSNKDLRLAKNSIKSLYNNFE
tara:strand:+ start:202 stop:963 length:762 start_codon:yes stop_codon:yes gene_type:complete